MSKASITDATTGPNLTEEQQAEFMDLAHQFLSQFTKAPGTMNLVQHNIKVTSDEQVRSTLYLVPYSLKDIGIDIDIGNMIKMGVISNPIQHMLYLLLS